MIAGIIFAGIMLFAAAVFLFSLIMGWVPLFNGKFRKFFIACSAIYMSGTGLITFLFMFMSLPFVFVAIAEIFILSVFFVSMFAIHKMGHAMDDIRKHNEEQNKKAD